ncbi:MAG: M1 family metallopeptidase [Flavobacteriales bacterium]
MKNHYLLALLGVMIALGTSAQRDDKFKQLQDEWPTPNTYRTASGAPGRDYWQQKADYDMKIRLDDENQRLYGDQTITYHNNSPDELTYIWIQLDQNMRAKDSDTYKIGQSSIEDRMSFEQVTAFEPWFDGGFKIEHVKDAAGKNLPYTINKTMMRVDLPQALKPGQKLAFSIKWWYNINDRKKIGGRAGYEYFPEEDNYLYTIAQFFPRMVVYCDNEGWQNKQFLGGGEFTLNFGDYKVAITVPGDHVVSATGLLQNEKEVLSAEQRKRLDKARNTYDNPVMIINEDEARGNEKSRAKSMKTWVFQASNVRDFAFASSRKFIWDAMAVKVNGKSPLAMSLYPKEGNPLWEQYSTKAVAQTLETYSKYTIDYPYPVAISVHTDRIGMEYPMICFNGGRPEADGTYSERTKYGMISVIIHEVGHNFFPMIINSDERQWTWMDEGLNTFCQYLTEKEWDRDYPSWRGPARKIAEYMGGDKTKIAPIMTNSESIFQFGNNAYGKPATALNILRETIMGRELFDYAFKEYARRWAFRHPTPTDFFRTMEDASAVDLDWFWRGWFYSTDHVDIAMNSVKWYQIDTKNPDTEMAFDRNREASEAQDISQMRNERSIPRSRLDADPSLHDYYTERDKFEVLAIDRDEYHKYLAELSAEEKALLESSKQFYEIEFENIGGLVMPLILRFEFADGTEEIQRIPAEIWKLSTPTVKKVFITEKEAIQITLDPYLETADTDLSNNFWPSRPQPTRFELYKDRQRGGGENPMQRQQRSEQLNRP